MINGAVHPIVVSICLCRALVCRGTPHLKDAMATPIHHHGHVQMICMIASFGWSQCHGSHVRKPSDEKPVAWIQMWQTCLCIQCCTHLVPNPPPYKGFEKFNLFFVCSSFRDGLLAPDPFSRMAAQIPVPPRWLLLIYNIIICQRQVLVERPTLTSEMVEQSCGFQCFCTKPQGNMGGTKPL